MPNCEAEFCPFWTGRGCACDVLDLDETDREDQREWLEMEGR